jgi:hypothetical protein
LFEFCTPAVNRSSALLLPLLKVTGAVLPARASRLALTSVPPLIVVPPP